MQRKKFINLNNRKNFATLNGLNKVLISAPHGVSQVRLGKHKVAEIGSIALALWLANETTSNFIAKTKNCFDDANFDEKSDYKDACFDIIKKKNVKYVLDFHGLASNRGIDINIGTHLGKNTENDEKILLQLKKELEKHFVVSIDDPFMAGAMTVSSSCKNKFPEIWAVQIEINCAITNKKENEDKLKILLNILKVFIKSLK
ncbi:MAG: hypothetical protein IJS74_03195 [Clostridia bacterium]|nr:hypothetical protein [Clostridia bacterium]